jgi:hypothetical protein
MKMRFMMTVRRVRAPMVTDGPFTETKELIGGYAFLRAGSRDEAIKLGKALTGFVGSPKEGRFEIREMPDHESEKS